MAGGKKIIEVGSSGILKGVETVKKIVSASIKLKIPFVLLFCFFI